MTLGYIISCYDKVDDTLAHLDILSFDPIQRPIIIVYMGEEKPPSEFYDYHLVQFESPGFTLGPLMSVARGLEKAFDLGLDYVVYRNGDDWFFNYQLMNQWFDKIVQNQYICAGYNWLSVNSFHDITLNELYMSVPHFMNTCDDAINYFQKSDRRFGCEYKMAWWVKQTVEDLDTQFFRLPDREQIPGIGRNIIDIPAIFKENDEEVPVDLWNKLDDNNRFFNKKWQLIGSHANGPRLYYWKKIRPDVAYAPVLERRKHFNRWIHCAVENKPWNSTTKNISRLSKRDRRFHPKRTLKTIPKKILWNVHECKRKTTYVFKEVSEFGLPPVNPILYMDNY